MDEPEKFYNVLYVLSRRDSSILLPNRDLTSVCLPSYDVWNMSFPQVGFVRLGDRGPMTP